MPGARTANKQELVTRERLWLWEMCFRSPPFTSEDRLALYPLYAYSRLCSLRTVSELPPGAVSLKGKGNASWQREEVRASLVEE